MAITVWPVNAVTGAPAYSGRMLRQAQSVALGGATSTRPLGARSGVRPGTSANIVTATSTTWTLKPHAGVLDMEPAVEAGPYCYAIDADVTGAVNAAHATLARVDLISVRLDDPAEGDGSSVPAVAVVYTAGTAGSGVPATPARCMTLAQINVPAAGGGSPTVTPVWPRLAAPGGIVPVRNVAERSAAATALGASIADPVRVWRGDAAALRQEEVTVDGSTWSYAAVTRGLQTWSHTLSTGSVGAGSITGYYSVIGNVCSWDLEVSVGAGAAAGSGAYAWGLPIQPFYQTVIGQGFCYYGGANYRQMFCQHTGSNTVIMRPGDGTASLWSSSYLPLAGGMIASFSGSYLIA